MAHHWMCKGSHNLNWSEINEQNTESSCLYLWWILIPTAWSEITCYSVPTATWPGTYTFPCQRPCGVGKPRLLMVPTRMAELRTGDKLGPAFEVTRRAVSREPGWRKNRTSRPILVLARKGAGRAEPTIFGARTAGLPESTPWRDLTYPRLRPKNRPSSFCHFTPRRCIGVSRRKDHVFLRRKGQSEKVLKRKTRSEGLFLRETARPWTRKVYPKNHLRSQGNGRPVSRVSLDDVLRYCVSL